MPLAPGAHAITPTVFAHVFEASEGGPTALIQAGIHGDEIAGVHALEELLEEELRPARGRVVIIPTMNRPAYRARTRAAPGGLDLNRCFPGDARSERPEHRLADTLMRLVLDERPALMATLHESMKRYDPDVTPSFGQTLVYGVDPMPALVGRAVDRLNARIEREDERWAAQHYPVATSSTEVIVDSLERVGTSCVGICAETWMGFELTRRVQMHRDVVRVLLDEVGVLPYEEKR